MTNGDTIRAMTDEEIATFIAKNILNTVGVFDYAKAKWLAWLESEARK